jgi:hypothetical protein
MVTQSARRGKKLMRIKLSLETIGETKHLNIDRVVMGGELLHARLPAVILRERVEIMTRQFFAPDGDNLTERVMSFLNEEREIAELKKAKEEADAKLMAALKKRTTG